MKPKIVVIGAGAFGGWSALFLQRSGAQVTLVDAWGAGNSRASSGGETRVIRHAYSNILYVNFAQRALQLWHEHCDRWQMSLYRQSGVLFLDQGGDFCAQARTNLRTAGIPHEDLSAAELARRWPQIRSDDLRSGMYEPEAGFLQARRACGAVLDALLKEGGEYLTASAKPGDFEAGELLNVRLHDGRTIEADQYVFACGPWLGSVFPELADMLNVTRQEVFFFGQPADRQQEFSGALPVWAEVGKQFWYGIPGDGKRGFKIASDTRGPGFDPTAGDRSNSRSGLEAARNYLGRRFPGMQGAPLLESRVCQYTDTPDEHFIIDRHPRAENCWILGGGSGHGFKHGPAIGEYVAGIIAGQVPEIAEFSLDRDYPKQKQGD